MKILLERAVGEIRVVKTNLHSIKLRDDDLHKLKSVDRDNI